MVLQVRELVGVPVRHEFVLVIYELSLPDANCCFYGELLTGPILRTCKGVDIG